MKKKIKVKGKTVEVEICNKILSKARGLMFKKSSIPLLFIFQKPTRQNIHSLFCEPFKAVWMLDEKIVDERIVKPFSLSVKSKRKFNRLLEIPLKNNNKLLKNSRRE